MQAIRLSALCAALQAAQAGDRRAYDALLRACTPLIGSVAARQGLIGGAIEDVVQETRVTIHHARHAYDPAALGAREAAEQVRAMVDRLPPGQREAVEHLALAERSLEDASSLTGRSKVALKVNVHRAIAWMRAGVVRPFDE